MAGKGIILAMPLGGEMHVTVCYYGSASDSGAPSAEVLHTLLRVVDAPQVAYATETAHFGKAPEWAFVHLLQSETLTIAHNFARALTLPFIRNEYPVYRPHVTQTYYEREEDMPPAGESLEGIVYEAPGLELWHAGVHYPLREPFPNSHRAQVGAQWDPYRAGFSASVAEFYVDPKVAEFYES